MNSEIIENMRYLSENTSTPEGRSQWLENLRQYCSQIITSATELGSVVVVRVSDPAALLKTNLEFVPGCYVEKQGGAHDAKSTR